MLNFPYQYSSKHLNLHICTPLYSTEKRSLFNHSNQNNKYMNKSTEKLKIYALITENIINA